MAKPLISVETIYETALNLLDTEGLEALSARKLAAALKCSPATLYQQVGKRDEMISQLLHYYFQSIDLSFSQKETWQESAYDWASSLRTALVSHPNLSRLLTPDNRHVIVEYVNQLLRVLLQHDFEQEFALLSCRVLTHQVISLSLTEIETPPLEIRRKKRHSKEIEFEDLIIAHKNYSESRHLHDLPDVFASAIKFTVRGIEESHSKAKP